MANRLDISNTDTLAQTLEGIVPTIRGRRKVLLEQWLTIHDAWKGQHTMSFFKSETFAHYIPYFRRSIERFAIRAAQMVLPTNEFFEVFPADEMDKEAGKRAEAVYSYFVYLLRKKIRTYAIVKQLFRTLGLYGRCTLKTGVKVVHEDGVDRVWPTARPVDPFMFTYWPETVSDLEDAQIIIEDALISVDQYRDEVSDGKTKAIDESKLQEPTWPDHITRRLTTSSITEPKSEHAEIEESKSRAKTDWIYRSEIWIRVPKGWKFIWIIWNLDKPTIVKVSKLVFPRPQYRHVIAREIPNEQNTSSMGDDQVHLQTLLNDYVNVSLEGQAMQFAGPVAVDNNLVQRSNSLQYKLRAKWLIPPEGLKPLITPSENVAKGAFQGVNFAMGLMDTFGGSGPMSEGQTQRNMPRAGFAVSSLLSMSLADIRDYARMVEEDILTPMLSDLYALSVRFIPERQVINIPGTQAVAPKSLYLRNIEGAWDLNWIGSLQKQDYEQRAQRFLSFIGNLAKLGQIIIPDLQQRGQRINWSAVLKRAWRDGLGERGADSLIEDIPQEQQVAMAQQSQQGEGAPNVDLGEMSQMLMQFQGDNNGIS